MTAGRTEVENAKRMEREGPPAIGAAKRQEAEFAEFKGFSGLIPSEFIQNYGPIRNALNRAFTDCVQDQGLPASFIQAFHAPQGKVDHRIPNPDHPLKGYFRDQILCLEKDFGIPFRFFLNAFQGYFQGEKGLSIFHILLSERLELQYLGADPEGGKPDIQPGIPGNRVIHDPDQENLETLHGRGNAGLNLHF
jgi:hypothetical protein